MSYNLYTDRKMYLDEVHQIFVEQAKHHAELTPKLQSEIEETIFHQRNLLPPEIGKCTLENNEPRARKACATTQLFRIYQEVNNLSVVPLSPEDPILNEEHRKKIVQALLENRHRTFGQLKTLLKFGRSVRFSLESEKRDRLEGATTHLLLGGQDCLGERWDSLSIEQKDQIVIDLFDAQEEGAFVDVALSKYGLEKEMAERLLGSKSKLDEGYGKISLLAMRKMLPHLMMGQSYAHAAQSAGYHHSDARTGEYFDRLPYYGEVLRNAVMGGSNDPKDQIIPEKYFGKINNPTVHIALNQLQKLVNAVIDQHGRPDEIVIELARDLKQPADEINREQAKNKKENDRINACLDALGVSQNYRNRMLYKLWEDLAKDPAKRCCPFSGVQISEEDIFSGKFEEEHLLPFSRSYNDSRSNKVLSHIEWNRRKGNRSPYEAFGHEEFWPEILARVQNLPSNKQWRFLEDAWSKVEGKDGIIARMLNDTRYMSKAAKAYLSAIFDIEKGKSHVWAVNGQMTALLRRKLGLNSMLGDEDDVKERADHRHHAIDAFVVALTDRGMIKTIADQARRVESTAELWEKRYKLLVDMEDPYPDFREQLQDHLNRIIVSHKPDHGNAHKAISAIKPYTTGKLHEESALGLIEELSDKKGKPSGKVKMAKRVPLESLDKLKKVQEVGAARIRDDLLGRLSGLVENGKEWKQALATYSQLTATKRVRVHIERERASLIGISSPKHDVNPYKYYATGNNYCVEIFEPKFGKDAGRWLAEVISTFEAHQKGQTSRWKKEHPTAKLVMRLQINDMVAYEQEGQTITCRVKKITKKENGARIYLRPHNVAKEEADKSSWGAFPNGLKEKSARKISVDILGKVKDPKKGAA